MVEHTLMRRIAAVTPVAVWLIMRELLFEYAFGGGGEWLEDNTWRLGDFLAWQPASTIIISVALVIVTMVVLDRASGEGRQEEPMLGKKPHNSDNDGDNGDNGDGNDRGGDQVKVTGKDNVVSVGQRGGITAGVVNIQTEPEAKVELSEWSEQKMDSGYLYEAMLTIETRYLIPQLRVTAHADSIKSLDITPQRGGILESGNAGKREGFHFDTLQNVAGKYKIAVVTARQEPVRIDFEE